MVYSLGRIFRLVQGIREEYPIEQRAKDLTRLIDGAQKTGWVRVYAPSVDSKFFADVTGSIEAALGREVNFGFVVNANTPSEYMNPLYELQQQHPKLITIVTGKLFGPAYATNDVQSSWLEEVLHEDRHYERRTLFLGSRLADTWNRDFAEHSQQHANA